MFREDKAIDYVFRVFDIPWYYYATALAISMVVRKIWKKPCLGFFAGYAFLILAETVMIRKPFTGSHFQSEFLWSWKVWDKQKEQIVANVVMFIPVGIVSGWLWKWKGLAVATGLSLTIEILQLVTARGLCEFDDVFHNAVGALIGISVAYIISKCRYKFEIEESE